MTVGSARADEYDAALRCMVLIEIAKQDYTGQTIDALREAGNRALAEVEATRPPDLTSQQKIDRVTDAINNVQAGGGLGNAGLRQEAETCAARLGVDLMLD